MVGHRRGVIDYFCGMQQRFGRNTTHIQAYTAQDGPPFNQNDIKPQVGSAKSRGISARPGTDHNQLCRKSLSLRWLLLQRLHCRNGLLCVRIDYQRGLDFFLISH